MRPHGDRFRPLPFHSADLMCRTSCQHCILTLARIRPSITPAATLLRHPLRHPSVIPLSSPQNLATNRSQNSTKSRQNKPQPSRFVPYSSPKLPVDELLQCVQSLIRILLRHNLCSGVSSVAASIIICIIDLPSTTWSALPHLSPRTGIGWRYPRTAWQGG